MTSSKLIWMYQGMMKCAHEFFLLGSNLFHRQINYTLQQHIYISGERVA